MADAGRVIAGSARGTRLAAPGPGTRPLADRVKQSLFGMLEPELGDARVLDLFAGSGAGGIEALSRGAAWAVFVDHDTGAARTIVTNLHRSGLTERGLVVRRDVLSWLARQTGSPVGDGDAAYDIVLVDPPYAESAILERVLERVGDVTRAGGLVVAKHFWRDAPPPRIGLLASERERRFGETALTFYRRVAGPVEADEA